MSKPQTTARALLLLLSLAKIAGHMNVNLASYYSKLAKVYGFRVVITAGAQESAKHSVKDLRKQASAIKKRQC